MPHALAVDDDIEILSVIRTWLELEGIDTVLAENGAASFAAFDLFNFDLMLVDIFMPEMDGLKVIKSFRKLSPSTPIIVMSGRAARYPAHLAPDFFAMAMRLGASYCLQKPFQTEQLRDAVTTCLRERDRGSLLTIG